MARIRTVKPSYPLHPKVRRVSRDARLLNIHLWNLADDEGRLEELPNWIIGAVFPTDEDVTPEVLAGWLDELHRSGLIVRYEVDGSRFIYCHDWPDHQKISRPTESSLPAPEQGRIIPARGLNEDSVSAHGGLNERSVWERKGKEGKGRERNIYVNEAGFVDGGGDKPNNVRLVFDAWVESTDKRPSAVKLTDKRRRLIRKALKDYPLEDVLDAVKGWKHSPHHRGENETRTVYNDIELLLRDAQRIERFRDLERGTAAKAGPDYSKYDAVAIVSKEVKP